MQVFTTARSAGSAASVREQSRSQAAIDAMVGAGDELCLVGGEERDQFRHFLGLADASDRVRGAIAAERLLDINVRPAEGARRILEDWRAHRAGADRRDAD